MFRFTQEPSSGSPKSVPSQNYRHGSTVLVAMSAVSVMAACSCRTFLHGELHTRTQVGICRHNTDNAHIDKQSGTVPVILARQ